jgi:Golgi phosphoprotein 3 GPP34
MSVSSGMDLVLCAIDADTGQVRFGPRLSYALAVAELADLEAAERIAVRADGLALLDMAPTEEPHADEALSALDEKWPPQGSPLTVLWWARWRGPRRIDPYLSAAWHAGITDVTDGVLTVLDSGPIHAAAARLLSVLEDREPTRADVAFVVLADAARVARPHLRGWDHRKHRARLRRVCREVVRGDDGRLLREGRKAISVLSSIATSDPRNFDQQIGLTPNARRAAIWFGIRRLPGSRSRTLEPMWSQRGPEPALRKNQTPSWPLKVKTSVISGTRKANKRTSRRPV